MKNKIDMVLTIYKIALSPPPIPKSPELLKQKFIPRFNEWNTIDTEPLSLSLDFQAQSEKKILSSLQRLSALGVKNCADLKRIDCALDQMKGQRPELKEYSRSLGQMLEVLERRSELVKRMQRTRGQCEDLEKLRDEALEQGENLAGRRGRRSGEVILTGRLMWEGGH